MIAPDFIESLMGFCKRIRHAMCHAAGLVFRGSDTVAGSYPPRLSHAVDTDPLARARHVMSRTLLAVVLGHLSARRSIAFRRSARAPVGTLVLAELH